MNTSGHGLVWRKHGGSAFMVWCKLSIYGGTSAYIRPSTGTAGVTAELIWPLRVAGPVLRGLRSPAALAE
jgi:hypothetical protein